MRGVFRNLSLPGAVLLALIALSGCVAGPQVPDSSAAPTASTAAPVPDDTSTIPAKPTAASVVPAITVAGADVDGLHVSASGFVEGVSEDGGVCTFVFTSVSGASAEMTSTGISNVDTTSCGLVELDRSQFSRGSWSVVLDYASLTSGDFTSAPIKLEIP